MRYCLYQLILAGLLVWSPTQGFTQGLVRNESIAQEVVEEDLLVDDFPGTAPYNEFMRKMEEANETFAYREPVDYPDHRLRVAFAMEGMRTFRSQLQELYLSTANDSYEAGLPIVAEMEDFLEHVTLLAMSTLKPLSAPQLMEHVHRLRCWLSYAKGALECEDRYFLKYALEHLSEHSRALRKAYGHRQCWEMTYWQRHYDYEHLEETAAY